MCIYTLVGGDNCLALILSLAESPMRAQLVTRGSRFIQESLMPLKLHLVL
jgi:hypothetical protein